MIDQEIGSLRYRQLAWFQARQGQIISWPHAEDHGLQLVTLAKGIFKPAGSDFALSLRIAKDGPYLDEPEFGADGSWIVRYHEERRPARGPDPFANRGLHNCLTAGAPVAVLQQLERKPRALYRVLGLGLVTAYAHGFFVVEGPVEITGAPSEKVEAAQRAPQQEVPIVDARERQLCEVVRRQGQGAFRTALLRAYSAKCALSGCDVEEVLEAAHIAPYMGQTSNRVPNGLLLRADVHVMFDLGLVRISAHDLTVSLSGSLYQGYYSSLSLRLPNSEADWPSRESLRVRESMLNDRQQMGKAGIA